MRMSVTEKREHVSAASKEILRAANTLMYSVEELAKRFNCSAKSVYRILATDKTAKEQLHKRRRLIKANVAKVLYRTGLTHSEIAKYLGGTRSNIGNLLRAEEHDCHPHIPITLVGEAKDIYGKKIPPANYSLQHLSHLECLIIGNQKRATSTFIVAYKELHDKVEVDPTKQFILPKVTA